ncbi:hypothetical protein BA011_38150 (plasmid) [Rhizobium leguminosarum]|uniref:Uncharacterized protein n=1 Tax=Rhizobium leguminosarum TaxID=384 RepID=A0A1B1CNT5_RHILE|nr:hypothetical protein BA011_38150 [Rhizobium leguminosarum]
MLRRLRLHSLKYITLIFLDIGATFLRTVTSAMMAGQAPEFRMKSALIALTDVPYLKRDSGHRGARRMHSETPRLCI